MLPMRCRDTETERRENKRGWIRDAADGFDRGPRQALSRHFVFYF